MAKEESKETPSKQGESNFHLVYAGDSGVNQKDVSKDDFLACLEVMMRRENASEASKKRAAPILLSQMEESESSNT